MPSDHGLWRVLRRGTTTLALASSLILGAGVGLPAFAAPLIPSTASGEPAEPVPAPSSPAELASQQAQASGQPVEVVAERGEDELVFANPDGTFTSEVTAGPQRVEVSEGTWKDVDPNLEFRPDGSVGPKVSTVDLAFPGSKPTTDLVRLGEDGRSMTLGWPTPLPRPELDGPVATYKEVLPGVDLKMRASAVGYSYVMVVNTPQSVISGKLAQLRLSVKSVGLTVGENANGGLAAVDGAGNTVFEGVQPAMWDSGSSKTPKPPKDFPDVNPDGAPTEPDGTPVGEAPQVDDPAVAPSTGDQVADVGFTVTNTGMTLVPDATLLQDPATVFPIYIDPNATVAKTDWAYVSSAHPSTEYHKFDDDEGVGRCSNWGGYVCSRSAFTNRMYFKFVPTKSHWAERVITKATFRAYETWSFSCTASWVDLSLVDAAKVNSGLNWNNKPADGDLMVDRKVAYGRGKSCNPDAPGSWVEFADNKEETNENLTATVRSKLKAGQPIAFSLSAKDEGDGNSWKRFKGSNASLTVTYNSLPSKPFNEKTTDPAMSCATGAARPYIWNDPPNLVVNATDPDSQNITVNFALDDATLGKNVQNLKVGPKAHTDANKKPIDFKAGVTAKLTHGHLYRWNARSFDGAYHSASFSDWCEFAVDLERPNAAPAVSSDDFPTDGANKKPGEAGSVTFAANGVKDSAYGNDVAYYEWAIGNDNPTNKVYPASLGGNAVATNVSAVTFGPNVLYARSVDRAGNRSEPTRYVFRAQRPCEDPAADTCAAAVYLLDETTGTTAADSSGKGRTLTVSGVDRADGQRVATEPTDRALRFAGGADFATAASAVDTRQGFTVTAWVKPSALTGDATVVSQAGSYGNGFSLSYSAAAQRWVFSRHKSDKINPVAGDVVSATAASINPPVAGQWTHVAAMFNPGDNRMSIFVDGQEQGIAEYTGTVWNAAAGLQVGRARSNDRWVSFFSGDIDDVRVFPGTLDPADMFDLWNKSRPTAN